MGISDDRYLSIHLARVEEMNILQSDGARPPVGDPLSWLLGADEGLHASEFASQRSTVFVAVGTHHPRSPPGVAPPLASLSSPTPARRGRRYSGRRVRTARATGSMAATSTPMANERPAQSLS